MSVFVNGVRWFNGLFTGVVDWNPTATRRIELPDDTGVVLLNDRPIGSLNAGVSVRGYKPMVIIGSISTKTLAFSDAGTIQFFAQNTNTTFLIPLNADVPFPIGTEISFLRGITAVAVGVQGVTGVSLFKEDATIAGSTQLNSFTTIRKIGVNTWSLMSQIPQDASLGRPTVLPMPAGDVSSTAANTAFVARSRKPIVIATRVTALMMTTTYTDFAFDNKMRDSSNAYNATTGVFTASYAGIYAFSVYISNFQATSNWTLVGLSAVANTELTRIAFAGGSGLHAPTGRQLVFLNAGETRRYGVQVGTMNAGATVEASLTTQVACYMSIEYLGIDT